MRDTFLPRIHTDVWGEVRPMCEAALSAVGVSDVSGRVWAKTVPDQRDVGTPYCVMDGDQDEAQTYQRLDKYGIGFDLEVGCASARLAEVQALAGEVKKRISSLDAPPEPDTLTHRYTRDLSDVASEALSAGQSDLHEVLVRVRLFYRTAN